MTIRSAFAVTLGVVFAATVSLGSGGVSPRIFYSDLESGPNTGGEKDGGAFVSLYGVGFGAAQEASFVTVGGAKAVAYPVWSDTRISFQLGKAASTGDILVTTSAGSSNAIPFVVRSGRIYFVAVNGKDSGKGSITSPWRTITHARDVMGPGDITYVREGVQQITDDEWNSCLLLGGKGGAPGKPLALVTYPGESATIGTVTFTKDGGCDFGIRTKGQGEHYWVFAGFKIRGAGEAMALGGVHDWRVIANDMTCPNGDGPSACFFTGETNYVKIYGNNVHDTGRQGASALYHGVYLGTNSNHIDFGWNTVANVNGCRGLHVYSSGGKDMGDLQIHDNLIHDIQCDGIILATVDPSQPGGVNVWNNIIYNAGKGPNTPEGTGAFFCINAQGATSVGPPGSGTIEVFNNTLFACGTWSKPPYGNANGGISMSGPNPNKRLRLRNNVISQTTNAPHILMDDGKGHVCMDSEYCDRISGANNLLWGGRHRSPGRHLTGTLFADPLFRNLAKGDFRPGELSRAATGGVMTPHTADRQGTPFATCKCRPIGALLSTAP